MRILLNGRFVPEDRARVSIFDRGFFYGEGLFEAILVYRGALFRWQQHWERLAGGAAFLKIPLRDSSEDLSGKALVLLRQNRVRRGILRVHLSGGPGRRGYLPPRIQKPTLVLSTHPGNVMPIRPVKWDIVTSRFQLPAGDPFAAFKTCDKLRQIAARMEASDQNADEAVLLNNRGEIVEGSRSNLFWIEGNQVCTPPLDSGPLPGITRDIIRELCLRERITFQEKSLIQRQIHRLQGVFVTLTSQGIVAVRSWDRRPCAQSPLVSRLQRAYLRLLLEETSKPQSAHPP